MKYRTLLIDPPWYYGNKNTGGGDMTSAAENKYPTMKFEDIMNLPVNDIAEEDAALFLWTTVPILPDALRLMDHWGFRYKTMITWKKSKLGMGYWYRGRTEHLLVGIKGKVKAFRCQKPNILECKTQKHSQKPAEFRQLIEMSCPLLPRIELFAREKHDNWTCLGLDLNGKDIKSELGEIIAQY